MTDNPECLHIRENLDALADEALSDAMRAHVAQCDECRDLRHEVREATRALGAAGGDYKHPENFSERVMAAAEARLSVIENAPADAPKRVLFAEKKAPLFSGSSEAPAVKSEPEAKSSADSVAKAPEKSEGAKVVAIRKSNMGPMLALVGVAAMAALVPVGIKRLRSRGIGAETTVATAGNGVGWSGRIALVSRASADRTGGIEVRVAGASTFAPIAQGATITAGSELRTDGRTRARIDLQDGTQFVLDRSTTLKLDTVGPRMATLSTGALMADVAHIDSAPSAKITLPTGVVSVLGTRFVLTLRLAVRASLLAPSLSEAPPAMA